MGKLQKIENALQELDPATFQTLCDAFLSVRNANFVALTRSGSQIGKNKTITGTPDSCFVLPNGKFLMVEYSTNVSEGVSKIKEDIQKCLDSNKTGIAINQIAEIVVCANFRINPSELDSLFEVPRKNRIALSVHSLDSLAIDLCHQHRNLVHEYLGMPMDRGQVVSIDRFITEHEGAGTGIATPLSNDFIERPNETESLSSLLRHSDFIIVTGPPGVGKTRLCIETINDFLKENESFKAFCVANKGASITDELHMSLDDQGYYILFVDDANRLDKFGQITGFYRNSRKGSLKVVITVRDYAYQEIGVLSNDLDPRTTHIPKLTDEQIVEIIKREPFKILNPDYHTPIKNVANGNPRIAIMAAQLAKKEQRPAALADVSDLFDKYYATFIGDNPLLGSSFNLKCLGVIAFFNTLPYDERNVLEPLLAKFDIDYAAFIDAIEVLDTQELAELRFGHVKVPEQNLAAFFFYRVFIKDDLLPFQLLLREFFGSHQQRFRDTIIPVNNTFGAKRVMDKLRPDLSSYWKAIKADTEKAFEFLEAFWFYMQPEVHEFAYGQIQAIEPEQSDKIEVKYELNQFSHHEDKLLELLSNSFGFTHMQMDAFVMAFDYAEKKFSIVPELIHNLREKCSFDPEDWHNNHLCQHELVDYLLEGLKENHAIRSMVFFEIAKTLLGFSFRNTRGGRNNQFVIQHVRLNPQPSIASLREKIWYYVDSYYEQWPDQALELLDSYGHVSPDVVSDVMELDVKPVLEMIDNHLKPESFEHCRCVQSILAWFKRNGIERNEFAELKARFTNELYERFLILSWDRLRDKESFEFDNHREYEQLKTNQITNHYILKTLEDVANFVSDFSFTKKNTRETWSIDNSLEAVIKDTFTRDTDLGLKLIHQVILQNDHIRYIPRNIFQSTLTSKKVTAQVFKLLHENEFRFREDWLLNFFYAVPEALVTKEHAEMIKETISSLKKGQMVSLDLFAKYETMCPGLLTNLFKLVHKLNKEGREIKIWREFISKFMNSLDCPIEVVEEFYLQQCQLQHDHFDYDLRELKAIISKDPTFFLKFVEESYDSRSMGFNGRHKQFGFIWSVPESNHLAEKVFDLMSRPKIS